MQEVTDQLNELRAQCQELSARVAKMEGDSVGDEVDETEVEPAKDGEAEKPADDAEKPDEEPAKEGDEEEKPEWPVGGTPTGGRSSMSSIEAFIRESRSANAALDMIVFQKENLV
jgi:hypothetical protein